LLIHGKDGEIEDRNNYKRDPYPPRANCSRQSVPATTASSFLVTQGGGARFRPAAAFETLRPLQS